MNGGMPLKHLSLQNYSNLPPCKLQMPQISALFLSDDVSSFSFSINAFCLGIRSKEKLLNYTSIITGQQSMNVSVHLFKLIKNTEKYRFGFFIVWLQNFNQEKKKCITGNSTTCSHSKRTVREAIKTNASKRMLAIAINHKNRFELWSLTTKLYQ